MKMMDFSIANCKNCYKCVRHCPIKAIKVENDQATIDVDRCVACGQCFTVCPQNARNISSDLPSVAEWIKEGKQVVASVAPAYLGCFPEGKKFVEGLRKLGFSDVQETAIGADQVIETYQEVMNNSHQKLWITTCCPTVNLLVEKYYKELIPYLLPVVSPMVAHSQWIKQQAVMGLSPKVVFIGPCISKKSEAAFYQKTGDIDAVLTFEEVTSWLANEKIDLSALEVDNEWLQGSLIGKQFPAEKGIVGNLKLPEIEQEAVWLPVRVSGMEGCKALFDQLVSEIHHPEIMNTDVYKIMEVNACINGCVGGPAGNPEEKNHESNKMRLVLESVKLSKEALFFENNCYNINNEMGRNVSKLQKAIHKMTKTERAASRTFMNKSFHRPNTTESQVHQALKAMGKFSKEDELNCGACGYETCKDKALSVAEGMSHPEMCVPNMRSKAERITNMLFEFTPNMVFVLDEELRVLEMNPTAERVFNLTADRVRNICIEDWLETTRITELKNQGTTAHNQKVTYETFDVVVTQTMIPLPNMNSYLLLMTNLTEDEERELEMNRLKENTLNTAQKIIDKQMRMAQEIASLLGETTAETKVNLTKLQKLIRNEGVGETKMVITPRGKELSVGQ